MSPTYLGNATTEYGAVDSEIFFQSRRARSVVIIYPVLRFHWRAGDNEMKMAKRDAGKVPRDRRRRRRNLLHRSQPIQHF